MVNNSSYDISPPFFAGGLPAWQGPKVTSPWSRDSSCYIPSSEGSAASQYADALPATFINIPGEEPPAKTITQRQLRKKWREVLGDESFNMPSNHVSHCHCLSVLRPIIFFQQLGRREHIEETTVFLLLLQEYRSTMKVFTQTHENIYIFSIYIYKSYLCAFYIIILHHAVWFDSPHSMAFPSLQLFHSPPERTRSTGFAPASPGPTVRHHFVGQNQQLGGLDVHLPQTKAIVGFDSDLNHLNHCLGV